MLIPKKIPQAVRSDVNSLKLGSRLEIQRLSGQHQNKLAQESIDNKANKDTEALQAKKNFGQLQTNLQNPKNLNYFLLIFSFNARLNHLKNNS